MRMHVAAILVAGGALLLVGCGFRPLYATGTTPDGMSAYFEQVLVEPIPGRQGVHLRNQLMDALTPKGTPSTVAYRLGKIGRAHV